MGKLKILVVIKVIYMGRIRIWSRYWWILIWFEGSYSLRGYRDWWFLCD